MTAIRDTAHHESADVILCRPEAERAHGGRQPDYLVDDRPAGRVLGRGVFHPLGEAFALEEGTMP